MYTKLYVVVIHSVTYPRAVYAVPVKSFVEGVYATKKEAREGLRDHLCSLITEKPKSLSYEKLKKKSIKQLVALLKEAQAGDKEIISSYDIEEQVLEVKDKKSLSSKSLVKAIRDIILNGPYSEYLDVQHQDYPKRTLRELGWTEENTAEKTGKLIVQLVDTLRRPDTTDFILDVYELAYGENAIDKGFTYEVILKKLALYKKSAHKWKDRFKPEFKRIKSSSGRMMHYCVELVEKRHRISKEVYKENTQ